jgi:hypothetical protein
MSCRACGRAHPPEDVTWSENNESKQPRPIHCPQCREAQRGDKSPSNWTTGSVAAAQACVNHGPHRPAPGGCCL